MYPTTPRARSWRDTNPRNGQPYFNVSLFSQEQLGQFGNSRRRFFHGPGLNNFDMGLSKTTKITESKQLELRFEAFNLFNHAQFLNPSGEIGSGFPSYVGGVNQGSTFGMSHVSQRRLVSCRSARNLNSDSNRLWIS